MSQSMDDFLLLAEQSFIRIEAEHLINECLQKSDPAPLNRLLEDLVLAGSRSLVAMREILDTIRSLKSTLSQEGLVVREDLMDAIAEFGIYLPQLLSADAPEVFRQICNQGLSREVRRAAHMLEIQDEDLLEEICAEAGARVSTIARRMALLKHFEDLVQDWIEGLAYEIAHGPSESPWAMRGEISH
jgi:hypothetical protein